MRPPWYYDQDFMAQRWSHYRGSTVQVIILSHLWRDQTCKLGFFFPHYIVLFVILCDGCFFTAEKKGEKRKCPITSYSRFSALFILACKTGALWAKLGKRGILGEAWDEGRRKIKRLLPVHCSGSCNARYIYTKGRIACKLLNAIFYCGQSTKVYCYCLLFALV